MIFCFSALGYSGELQLQLIHIRGFVLDRVIDWYFINIRKKGMLMYWMQPLKFGSEDLLRFLCFPPPPPFFFPSSLTYLVAAVTYSCRGKEPTRAITFPSLAQKSGGRPWTPAEHLARVAVYSSSFKELFSYIWKWVTLLMPWLAWHINIWVGESCRYKCSGKFTRVTG